ncbi:hypothetical protein IWQ60_010124 [Tieghemiomyces parasiticus]|uniref:Fork-head domain-containing protein n=1 Tax=Tieghemiomyces parasiticus TaxID=78921 RepID=A0A9W8DIV1_9FUNG|nr:hypothetical protein IWQ60_010124 [Tieghemiomyces parasiticus]
MSPSTTVLHRRSSAYQPGAVGGTDSHQLGDTFITLSPESVRKPTRKRRRPPVSYSVLIAQAILTSKDRRLTLREVYQWVSENHPYLSNSSDNGWQNTIRHNLSLNKCFVKVARADNEVTFNSAKGKGGYWTVNPDLMDSAVREGLDRAMRVPLPQRTAAEAQKAHQQQQQQIQREQRETTPLSTSGGPLNPAPANLGTTPPPLPRSFTQSPSRPLAINTGVGSPSDAYLAQASSSLSLSAGPSAKASPLPSYAMLVDGCPMASALSVGSGQHRYQQNQLLPPVVALQPVALLDSDSSAYHTPIRPHSQPPANSTPLVSPISSPGAASYTGGSPTRGATTIATANACRASDAMTDYTMSPRFAPTAPVMDTTAPTTVPIGSALGLADTLTRAPISGPHRHHRGEGGTPESESSDVSVLKIRNLLN